jgi:hypothetical protein
VAQDFSPFTTDNPAYQHLQAALAGKTLSGEVYGFDIAGNIIDAYTLALVVGFPNITSGPLPGVNDMLVQLVDAHGQPLDPAGTTMDSLKFDPPLQALSVGAEGEYGSAARAARKFARMVA